MPNEQNTFKDTRDTLIGAFALSAMLFTGYVAQNGLPDFSKGKPGQGRPMSYTAPNVVTSLPAIQSKTFNLDNGNSVTVQTFYEENTGDQGLGIRSETIGFSLPDADELSCSLIKAPQAGTKEMSVVGLSYAANSRTFTLTLSNEDTVMVRYANEGSVPQELLTLGPAVLALTHGVETVAFNQKSVADFHQSSRASRISSAPMLPAPPNL